MEEQPLLLKVWRGQLEMIVSALHDARLTCAQEDCLHCAFYGDIEGRLERALREKDSAD